MARHTQTIDANESVLLCSAKRPQLGQPYLVTVHVTGDFDSGTVSIQSSVDNGTTKVTLKDVGGNVVAVTADDVYNIELGYPSKNGETIDIYATMDGSGGSPDIVVTGDDNI